jgi:hypothetical protein
MNDCFHEMEELLKIWQQSQKEKGEDLSQMLYGLVKLLEVFCSNYREVSRLGKKIDILSYKIEAQKKSQYCDEDDCDEGEG